MAAEIITLQYTSGSSVAYSLVLSSFLDEEIPRKIVGEAAIERTILGMTYSTGPSVKHRNIWTLNALLKNEVTSTATKGGTTYNEVGLLREMYDAWDTDRANGLAAKCVLTDGLLSFGSSYVADVWFSEPPVYSLMSSYASKYISVVMGLTEV
jgi:hypothetical protein